MKQRLNGTVLFSGSILPINAAGLLLLVSDDENQRGEGAEKKRQKKPH